MLKDAASGLSERRQLALGWTIVIAACVVCLATGRFLARWVPAGHKGPLLPWGVGLALAAGVACLAPQVSINRWLAARSRRAAAIALLAVFLTVEFAMAWLGYLTFRHYDGDIKLFVDMIQLSFRSQLFHVTQSPSHTESYLLQHWALQIFLWLPAWMAWPDPRVLLLIQIVGFVAMAAAVYRLASVRLGPGPWPLAITAAVVLVPGKGSVLSAELGNAPFLAFLIVAAVLCVHCRRPVAFVVTLIVILMSREDAAVLAAVLAIYAWWTAGWRRLGAAAVVVSGVWLVVVLKAVMPSFPTMHGVQPRWDMYGWLGAPSAALSNPLDTADRVLVHLLRTSVPAVAQLLTSFGILPFVAGAAWLLWLGLLPALLTGTYPASLAHHHAYPAIAIAAVLAVEGARRVDRRLPPRSRLKLAVVLTVPLTALSLHAVFGYSPLTRSFTWSEYWPTPHTRALWAALSMVPSDAALAGSHYLSTHRYVGHPPGCVWEYVSVRTIAGSPEFWCDVWDVAFSDPFILIDRPRPTPELQHLLTASPYGVVFHQQDIALFRQGADTSANRPLARWAFGDVRDTTNLPSQIGSLLPDATSRPGRAVRAPRGKEGFVLYGWYVWACPTPHELVVRLRGDSRWRRGSPGRVEIVADQGTRVLAARALDEAPLDPADYRELVVPVAVTEAGWIEARVYSTGRAAFWVDSVALVSVTPSGAFEPPGESCAQPSHSPALGTHRFRERDQSSQGRVGRHGVAPRETCARSRAAAMLRSLMSS